MDDKRLKMVEELGGKLLDMQGASDFLGIPKSSLYGMVMRKEIAHIKIGRLTRFTCDHLLDLVEKNTVEACPHAGEGI